MFKTEFLSFLTSETFLEMIHDAEIDLDPPYQRGSSSRASFPGSYLCGPEVVWSEPKQSHLIESIYRNFYIPPVVFAIQRDEDGFETRVCVDGKQVGIVFGTIRQGI